MSIPFLSLYRHGFCRVAVCTPQVHLANPSRNVSATAELAAAASNKGAILALFPELGISGYSNEDLFFQDALLDSVERALDSLLEQSRSLKIVLIVGAPLRLQGKLFNCALIICAGSICGAVPKTYLPNYREFYEKRQFTSGPKFLGGAAQIANSTVPFGRDLLFESKAIADFVLHVEVCEDLWVPIPPSTLGALAGATVLANLSASNITVGKADYRRLLCASQSAKCLAAYLYSGAGVGESTTDLAWDGHGLIYENGEMLAETNRFSRESQIVLGDIDLDRLVQDRARTTSFGDCVAEWSDHLSEFRHVELPIELPDSEVHLIRTVYPFPYVPADLSTRHARCSEVFQIQVQGLATRLQASRTRKAVIGVSGGLDSAHALLVTTKCFDDLGWPRGDILACWLPGFASTTDSQERCYALTDALNIPRLEIDIRPSALQMLHDIGHPYSHGENCFDTTFENVQAGERTSHLFRLANLHNALVVGTSDLSELALGYTTYGVGDQMAHYHVNAAVPKTLIQYLIRWFIVTQQFDSAISSALQSIVDALITAELVPGSRELQEAEATVGPYVLQDFNLYYLSRYGYRPSKVAYLAQHAWSEMSKGAWPDWLAPHYRMGFDLSTIVKWLEIFIRRFFETSQFKRSALPNAPKVGSGGSLSPRSDWRAPSDSSAELWLEELRSNLAS